MKIVSLICETLSIVSFLITKMRKAEKGCIVP